MSYNVYEALSLVQTFTVDNDHNLRYTPYTSKLHLNIECKYPLLSQNIILIWFLVKFQLSGVNANHKCQNKIHALYKDLQSIKILF
jgi:hypothetical protein